MATVIEDVRIGGVDGGRWIEVATSHSGEGATAADMGTMLAAPDTSTLRLDVDQARYLHARLAELIAHLDQE